MGIVKVTQHYEATIIKGNFKIILGYVKKNKVYHYNSKYTDNNIRIPKYNTHSNEYKRQDTYKDKKNCSVILTNVLFI